MDLFVLVLLVFVASTTVLIWATLRRCIHTLEHDTAYDMLTRPGGERRLAALDTSVDLVFLDIDGMHDANATHGYEEVNRRLRGAFRLRRCDRIFVCRWFSGDEILIAAPSGTGQGLATRVQAQLKVNGLDATFVVVARRPRCAVAVVAAQHAVARAKADGRRGVIERIIV